MKTRPRSPVDRGRRAAERFVPKSLKTVTREALVDYCGVMYARGEANASKRIAAAFDAHDKKLRRQVAAVKRTHGWN